MKTTGAIKNLVQGVSTQNPKERIEGQVWTMSNCIPDPVEGAVKRPGVKHIRSTFTDLAEVAGASLKFSTIAIGSSSYAIGTYDGNIIMRNLTTGADVEVRQDPASVAYFKGGISASTNIGDYTLLAGTSVPAVTQQVLSSIHTQAYTDSNYTTTATVNRVVIVEIRQGAYSGTYTIRRSDGTSLASFTVANGGTATDSTQVQPSYIAAQLTTQLVAAIGGSVGGGIIRGVHRTGASIAIFLYYNAIDEACALFADDGAYNTRMIMSDRFASTSTTLPSVGVEGHVIEVGKTNRKSGNYFVRFEHTQGGSISSTPSLDTNKLRPGRWVETSRSYISTGYSKGGILTESSLPSLLYFFDGIAYIGTGTYIAAQVLAQTGNVITPLAWGNRVAGDDDSAPDPFFVGSTISWMGVFQDRLVILSKGAVSMSRTADYLNFYRASVIDDLATDPINLTSTFDSTDQLVGAALLDKNLVVIGTKTHYAIIGRTGITPTNAAILKTSAFESSPNVPPVSFGNMVYFASASQKNSDILAIQPSDTVDSTYAYPVSSHVDGYIPGNLVSLTASTKLNILFALSGDGVLYCYRTLFNQGERVLSAWFDFTFGTSLKLSAVSLDNTRIRMLFAGISGGKLYTTVGELNLDRIGYTGTGRNRYLDFWQDFTASTSTLTDTTDRARCIYGAGGAVIVDLGSGLAQTDGVVAGNTGDAGFNVTFSDLHAGSQYMTGIRYLEVFEPTIPLPRTQDGKVTSVGKLVIGQMKVNYTVGAQFDVEVNDKYRSYSYQHSARRVGAPDSFVDDDYISDGWFLFAVGSGEPDTRVAIKSYDHYPLVLSSIDWTGQFFKRGANM